MMVLNILELDFKRSEYTGEKKVVAIVLTLELYSQFCVPGSWRKIGGKTTEGSTNHIKEARTAVGAQ